MTDIIHVEDKYYILATSPFADDRTRVLKHGDTFAVYDRNGDVTPIGLGEQGLYHEGTRFLSKMVLRIGERRPLLLSSTVIESNDLLAVDLTNPDLFAGRDAETIVHGSLHLFRSRFLWEGVVYERLRVTNYARRAVAIPLEIEFAADFADVFEVRGVSRAARGEILPAEAEPDRGRARLAYRGLDAITRRTIVTLSPPPPELRGDRARFDIDLAAAASSEFFVTVACQVEAAPPRIRAYETAFSDSRRRLTAHETHCCHIRTSSEPFNDWVDRSVSDLLMLLSDTENGPYPYAGVPWFSSVFGRDGIITALEWLWANPAPARGVLLHLAATQAGAHEPDRDAEPGKILHESRCGEMAARGEIPFGRYYGTIDATPLFVTLAGAYYRRTGDRELVRRLWPAIERALAWMDDWGDRDRDGFVEYAGHAGAGLSNQGWKDSVDSVFGEDGRLLEGPIALAEVQGYVYSARRQAALLAAALGKGDRRTSLEDSAAALRRAFDRRFWCDDIASYALALDGDKRPARVRTSNAGHCLYSEIALPERAPALARTLLAPAMFSGWGVRTVAATEPRYNPMSYHNGSVWPHDSAIVAAGLAGYGFVAEASRIAAGLFDASQWMDLHRLPELFCGFVRRRGEGPTRYPVACAPQAWAAGAVFLLVRALLGLTIDAPARRISLSRPRLPPFLDWIDLENLQVGDARVDLAIERHPDDASVRVLRRDGDVEIAVVK